MSRKHCPFLDRMCLGDECQLWKELIFKDAQDKSEVKKDCSIAWMPILQIETGREVNHASSSIDKMATEMQTGAGMALIGLLARKPKEQAIEDQSEPRRITGS